jgi:hypothetical protein
VTGVVRGLVSLLLAIVLVAGTARCLAVERRVALVLGDAELQRQLELALQAWEVETLTLDVAPPAATQPEAMNQAADLAASLGLDGLVWVTDAAQGSLLWVYDARSGQVTTRAIAERPPFGSATAAGLALSVKTTLRASVEPLPQPPRPSPEPAPPVPIVALEPLPLPRSEPQPLVAPRTQVAVALDAQLVADQARRAWYSLQGAVWLGASRRAGVGLRVGFGSAVSVEAESLRGRFHEVAFGPSLELRLASSSAVAAQAFVGGTLHVATLESVLTRESITNEVSRYNVALDAGGRIHFRIARGALIGLQLGAAYFLGYQRFMVEGTTAFAPWRLVPSGGAHVGVEY